MTVTAGILRLMSNDELAAILAHEPGHVKNRDILISSVAARLGSAFTYFARMGCGSAGPVDTLTNRFRSAIGTLLMLVRAPVAAALIRMAISRASELSADETSARTSADAQPMIDALTKRELTAKQIPLQVATFDVAYIHHEATARRRSYESVLHSSAYGRANRCTAQIAGRLCRAGDSAKAQPLNASPFDPVD